MTSLSPLGDIGLWAIDIGDLIPIIVFILFIISAIGKLLIKQKPQRPGQPGQAKPGQPPRPAQPIGDVEDEIADFLRRAVGQRGGRPQPPQPAPQPAVAQVVEPEVTRPVGGRVSRHVGEHLDTAEFEQRAAQLGDEVADADDEMGRRLHEKFDHEVGRLAQTPGESATASEVLEAAEPQDRVAEFPTTAAAGLPAMLANAQSIRQAIVISEILTRPEHRWS